MKQYNVAVAGVTGAVGNVLLSIMQERKFPVKNLTALASVRSEGKKIKFLDEEIEIKELSENSFKNIDIALFSAGASRSKEFAPHAAESGAVVIDNSSAFRMDDEIPLVVPEVNPNDAFRHKGIIANPNCSTIIMAVAIKPLYDISPIKRIVVSTYQSVSGAGAKAIAELEKQSREIICEGKKVINCSVFPVQIAFNVIPHIDVFLENGYTKEEMKMHNETRKIFNDYNLSVSATTVRVPVFTSHSESINIETRDKITVSQARKAFLEGSGLTLMDDISNIVYPTPLDSSGKDNVFIGRIREDISVENGLSLWAVGDQLRKGAALNAVQIAELICGIKS
ncbi:MAG: Aspartate-semialdehyde dehydrogenase [Actinobacteria bacterium ADurb.Bin346]|nr:MAG: Aspartate-semialdehyde dehydrogenase [Actinobacteria bacterium ADurb.Bin346]